MIFSAGSGSSSNATLIATLAVRETVALDLARLPAEVAWVEVRADLVGDLDPDWLRAQFAGRLLYTLRSSSEGGAGTAAPAERQQRLVRAAASYDAVDLEGARDLSADTLAGIAAARRVISWHSVDGPALDLLGLRARFAELSAVPAALYKMVPRARAHGEELRPLALLKSLERPDLVAFAGGELGTWTRFLAPRLGAPAVYLAAGDAPAAPGQPSARRAIADLGLPWLPGIEALSGIAGNPVSGSLSPRLHNALYRALGIARAYLPFEVESFGDFWLEVVESGSLEVLGFPLTGLSVTAPFKAAALAVAGATSPLVERIGGANTLIKNGNVWEAESTDPEGVVAALLRAGVPLLGRRAAVVGAGGAGRSAAEGLRLAGALVTMANRDSAGPPGGNRDRAAAAALGAAFVPLAELRPQEFDVVVNATPLGRAAGDPLPFDTDHLRPDTAVLDLVYGEAPTALVAAVRSRGGVAVDGREVLLEQAAGQFRMMTGLEMPRSLARAALELPPEPA